MLPEETRLRMYCIISVLMLMLQLCHHFFWHWGPFFLVWAPAPQNVWARACVYTYMYIHMYNIHMYIHMYNIHMYIYIRTQVVRCTPTCRSHRVGLPVLPAWACSPGGSDWSPGCWRRWTAAGILVCSGSAPNTDSSRSPGNMRPATRQRQKRRTPSSRY